MKQVINGKLYNTDTAIKLAVTTFRDASYNPLSYVELFVTKKGNFFLNFGTQIEAIDKESAHHIAKKYIAKHGNSYDEETLEKLKELGLADITEIEEA